MIRHGWAITAVIDAVLLETQMRRRKAMTLQGEMELKAEQKPSTPRKRKFQAEKLGYSVGIYIDKLISTSEIPKKIVIEIPEINFKL